MKRTLSFIIIVTFIFSNYILTRSGEKQDRSAVLKFSHQLHVEEAGMECSDCHGMVEESQMATDRNLPEKDVCETCHDVESEDNCTLCHVNMENLQSFENPQRDYYFNHKLHVTSENMDCETCHSGIEKVDMGDGEKIPSREICNTCHNGLKATMVCMECHPMDTKFRPDNHVMDWQREHMVEIRAGGTKCAHCHTNNYCQECHESTDLISTKILPENFYATYSPQAKGNEGIILKAVHDLNYRFLHQLDALGREKDCRICHETSAYCGECHSSGTNSGIRPAWHGGPDWGALALAIGSGGGRHAELARRDIERCAACHDVQGADPACLQCHIDLDGIKFTDPKTHESGFANRFGEDSSFHSDNGAVCYMCHVNSNQAGLGFCGYCHGQK
ncbi:cytochrome C [candidate division KSB1 bacterium]|nr:cytochrome C [candidate division KSB1 bacterium]